MLVIDSQRRCPRCSKRLVSDVGQNDTEGDLELLLYCLNDDYREMQRPERDKRSDGPSLLARLRDKVRAGYDVPIVYDEDLKP